MPTPVSPDTRTTEGEPSEARRAADRSTPRLRSRPTKGAGGRSPSPHHVGPTALSSRACQDGELLRPCPVTRALRWAGPDLRSAPHAQVSGSLLPWRRPQRTTAEGEWGIHERAAVPLQHLAPSTGVPLEQPPRLGLGVRLRFGERQQRACLPPVRNRCGHRPRARTGPRPVTLQNGGRCVPQLRRLTADLRCFPHVARLG